VNEIGDLRASVQTIPDECSTIRVLHVVTGFGYGGLEKRLISLLGQIPREQVAIDVLCKGKDLGAMAPIAVQLGARVFHCPFSAPLGLSFASRFCRIVEEGQYDIVHSHGGVLNGLAVFLARTKGVKTIASFISTDPRPEPAWSQVIGLRQLCSLLTSRSVRYVVRHGDFVTGVSVGVLDALVPDHRHRLNCRVIHSGVKLNDSPTAAERAGLRQELQLGPGTPLILHVGRFSPAKNHHGLLTIFRVVQESVPKAKLLLVGTGPLRSSIEDEIRKGGLADSVMLLGLRDDVARLMRCCDVLLLPSLFEGLPVVALEALSSYLPIVASDIPGVRDEVVRDGETGLIRPVDDVNGLAEAVVNVLQDRALAERLASSGRELAETEYSLEATAQRYMQLYRDCMNEDAGHAGDASWPVDDASAIATVACDAESIASNERAASYNQELAEPRKMGSRAPGRMSRANTVGANAVWMMIGNVSSAIGRWLLLVIFAKFATEAAVGQYGWALAFCMPIIVLCRPAARVLISTDPENRVPFGVYLGVTLTGTVLAIAVIGAITGLRGYDPYLMALIIGVTLWNSCESISDAFAGLFLRRARADLLAAGFIVQAVLMVALATVGLLLTGDMRIAVFGLTIAALARIFCWEIPVARRLTRIPADSPDYTPQAAREPVSVKPIFEWSSIWRLLVVGAPIAVVGFLTVACMSVPRYVVKEHLGDAQAGVFFALYQVGFAQYILINAIGQSLWSHLADLFGRRQRAEFGRRIAQASMVTAAIGLPAILVAALFGRQLLSIMFTPAYAADNVVFVVLMLAGFLEGLVYILISAITSMQAFRIQVPIYLIKLALTYFGSLWAVRNYGLVGVSCAMAAAAMITLVVTGFSLIRLADSR
jgi:glycosyltransferase EpsF